MTSSDDNSPGSPSDVPISPTEAVLSALREVAATLTDSGIRYALIGGLAVAMRGQVRATKDVDLLLSVPQLVLPKFLERVLERGFKLDVTESIRVWNADGLLQIVSPLGIRVDLLRSVLPVFDRVLDRASDEDFEGSLLRVADVESLLLMKLISFRLQDQLDIRSLLAAHSGSLDLDFVRREWASLAELDPERLGQFEALVLAYG